MIIDRVWHFDGDPSVPPQLRGASPIELSDSDLTALTLVYAVMIYRNDERQVVLALDTPRGRFRQR